MNSTNGNRGGRPGKPRGRRSAPKENKTGQAERGESRRRDDRYDRKNARGSGEHKNRRNVPAFQPHKLNTPQCARCGQPISDLAAALAEKNTGDPVHFDCVLEFLQAAEQLKPGEKITYIGQGRFAVVVFENPHDLRHFTIVRVIEWEERDKKPEWRTEIAGLYSQVR